MYADLEKIEARGKRKKNKGFFSTFSKKDETEPEAPLSEAKPAPVKDMPKPESEIIEPVPEPVAIPLTKVNSKSPNIQDNSWKPLSGNKLKKAEEIIIEYKKWLNHGLKAGLVSKDQCTEMVHDKKIELGLRPPHSN
jgi:hypothetical protein